MQFLLEDRPELGTLAVQVAVAWARQGLRVLLVHEYKPYRTDMALTPVVHGSAKPPNSAGGPGLGPSAPCCGRPVPADQRVGCWPISTLLGRLRPPTSGTSRATTLPLLDALQWGRRHFDSVVLAGRPTWPHREFIDCFVVLAAGNRVPVADTLTHGAMPEDRHERPLTAELSGALLRERHPTFHYHRPRHFSA
ncbi:MULTISPECIES: hypothetical protein [unclassified Streptomyces]|uniref:hypothetical protein n=1 Tax=unclassified Streptomyces TaxID=2593676 RepID=UPI0024739155|nr:MULTISPECIES: hypothetical protein [unclassified Streptomyces]